jgi:hypothetical protein
MLDTDHTQWPPAKKIDENQGKKIVEPLEISVTNTGG